MKTAAQRNAHEVFHADALELQPRATPGKVSKTSLLGAEPGLISKTALSSGIAESPPEPVLAERLRGSFAVVAIPHGYALVGRVGDLTKPADIMATLLAWLGADEVPAGNTSPPQMPLISRYFALRLEQALTQASDNDSPVHYWTWSLAAKDVDDVRAEIRSDALGVGAGRTQGGLATGYFRYSHDYRAHDPVHNALYTAMATADDTPQWLTDWSRPTAKQWQSNPDWAARQDAELLRRLGRSWWVGAADVIDEILGQTDDRLLAIAGAYNDKYDESLDDALVWITAAPSALGPSYERKFDHVNATGPLRLESVRITGDRTRLLRWARDVAERRRRVRGYEFLRMSTPPGRDGSSTGDMRTLLWIFGHSSPQKPPSQQMADYFVRILTDGRDGDGGHLCAVVALLQQAAADLCPDDSGAVQLGPDDISNTFVAWSELLSDPYARGEIGNYVTFACHSAGIPVRYEMTFNQPGTLSPFALEELGGQIQGGLGQYRVRIRDGVSLDTIFHPDQMADDDWITINWYVEGPSRAAHDRSSRFTQPPQTQGTYWKHFPATISKPGFDPDNNSCDIEFRYADAGTHRVIAMITWPDIEAPAGLWGNVAFVSHDSDVATFDDTVEREWQAADAIPVGQLLAQIENRRVNALAHDTSEAYEAMVAIRSDDWDCRGVLIRSLPTELATSSVRTPPPQEQTKYRKDWATHYLYPEASGTPIAEASWYVIPKGGRVEGAQPVQAQFTDLNGIAPDTVVYPITRTDFSLEGLPYVDNGILRFQTMFPGDYTVLCQPHGSRASAAMYPIRIFDPDSERVAEDNRLSERVEYILDEYQNGDLVYLEGNKTKLYPVKGIHVEKATGVTRQVHLYLGCTNPRPPTDRLLNQSYGTIDRGYRDGTGWLLFDFSPDGVEQSVYGNQFSTISDCLRKLGTQSRYPDGRILADWDPRQVNPAAPRSYPYVIDTHGRPWAEQVEGWLGAAALGGVALGGLMALTGVGAPLACFIFAGAAGSVASTSSIVRNFRRDKLKVQTFAIDVAGLAAMAVGLGGLGFLKYAGRAQNVRKLGTAYHALRLSEIATNIARIDLTLSSLEFLLLSAQGLEDIAKVLHDDTLDTELKTWRVAQVFANLAITGALYGYGAKGDMESVPRQPQTPPIARRRVQSYAFPSDYDPAALLRFVEDHDPAYAGRIADIAERGNGQLLDLHRELAVMWEARGVRVGPDGPENRAAFDGFGADLREIVDQYHVNLDRRYRAQPVERHHYLFSFSPESFYRHVHALPMELVRLVTRMEANVPQHLQADWMAELYGRMLTGYEIAYGVSRAEGPLPHETHGRQYREWVTYVRRSLRDDSELRLGTPYAYDKEGGAVADILRTEQAHLADAGQLIDTQIAARSETDFSYVTQDGHTLFFSRSTAPEDQVGHYILARELGYDVPPVARIDFSGGRSFLVREQPWRVSYTPPFIRELGQYMSYGSPHAAEIVDGEIIPSYTSISPSLNSELYSLTQPVISALADIDSRYFAESMNDIYFRGSGDVDMLRQRIESVVAQIEQYDFSILPAYVADEIEGWALLCRMCWELDFDGAQQRYPGLPDRAERIRQAANHIRNDIALPTSSDYLRSVREDIARQAAEFQEALLSYDLDALSPELRMLRNELAGASVVDDIARADFRVELSVALGQILDLPSGSMFGGVDEIRASCDDLSRLSDDLDLPFLELAQRTDAEELADAQFELAEPAMIFEDLQEQVDAAFIRGDSADDTAVALRGEFYNLLQDIRRVRAKYEPRLNRYEFVTRVFPENPTEIRQVLRRVSRTDDIRVAERAQVLAGQLSELRGRVEGYFDAGRTVDENMSALPSSMHQEVSELISAFNDLVG